MSRESYLDPHPRHRDPWNLARSFDYLNGKGHELPAMWTDGEFLAFDAEVEAQAGSHVVDGKDARPGGIAGL